MNMLKLIRNTKTGAEILDEWLGGGGIPVRLAQSTNRALICSLCDQNEKGSWWETATNMVSIAIRRHLEVKNDIEVSTPYDKEIGTCKVCLCNLPLKVHVPIEHIQKHTSPESLSKFPANCWIPKEINS